MEQFYLSDDILKAVEKPGRYIGGELNSAAYDPALTDTRIAYCFADNYDIGMSHLGFKMLYELMNSIPGVCCERVFAPWTDLEAIMREKNLRLFALESQQEIRSFDMVAFTLQYEMSYTNVLNMLDLAGIPLLSSERGEGYPLVFAGGPSANNPEPMADFFDFFNIGEGEEMLPEIISVYRKCRKEGLSKEETLKRLSLIDGVYVPSFYRPVYDENGMQTGLEVIDKYRECAKPVIRKRIVSDFENAFYPDKLLVPNVEVVHDRIMLEIFRGCIRGCRFCQAGYIYRPVRERSYGKLIDYTKKLIASTGYEEVSLLSLSTSDYTQLGELTDGLLEVTNPQRVSLALPSLRIDSFSMELMEKVSCVRKSGITFAPEAGTQRMRDIINKGVTEEDLLRSVRMVFENGYNNVKLYFMLGLPFETDEDLVGIAELAGKVLKVYDEVHEGRKARRPEITVSVSTFVPKPFTPFQWAPQISIPEIIRRQDVIKKALNRRISFSWHDAETSVLEGAISRGSRKTGKVIYDVWKSGSSYDAWADHMDFGKWTEAFGKNGMRIDEANELYADTDAFLPWNIVDVGVSQSFLKREFERARTGTVTPNCRDHCSGCGCASYGRGICVE